MGIERFLVAVLGADYPNIYQTFLLTVRGAARKKYRLEGIGKVGQYEVYGV